MRTVDWDSRTLEVFQGEPLGQFVAFCGPRAHECILGRLGDDGVSLASVIHKALGLRLVQIQAGDWVAGGFNLQRAATKAWARQLRRHGPEFMNQVIDKALAEFTT